VVLEEAIWNAEYRLSRHLKSGSADCYVWS
jgi:hypothetical protein